MEFDLPRLWCALLLMLPSLHVLAASSDKLSALEARGRELYVHGMVSGGHEPKARIGGDGTEVGAGIVPCVGCHGEDGRGRPEGGVVPPDITWRHLTKSYGHRHGNLRQHPAFTEKSFAASLKRGVDPAGNQMDSAMPRYEFSAGEVSALVAYLKRLEFETAPGVSDGTIRVGSILPLRGSMAAIGEGMKGVLSAYFDAINAQGGIYNRRLELRVAETGETPEASLANARRLMAEEPIFAWISPAVSGADREMAALAEQEAIPMLAPLSLFPEAGDSVNRYSFYLFSGIREQVGVLVDQAAAQFPSVRKLAVIHPATDAFREVGRAVTGEIRPSGWDTPIPVEFGPGRFETRPTVDRLKAHGIDVVAFLGSGEELKGFLSAADGAGWRPPVLVPGSGVPSDVFDLPPAMADKLLLAFPNLPRDHSPDGVAALTSLRAKAGVTGGHIASQVTAYSAALLLTEGLKAIGRDVSRKKFVGFLEGLYQFDTGLTRRISFGPNRHIGAAGGYVVGIDVAARTFKPLGDWKTVTDPGR
jgi:ABC-type branched-subunit amino acid transport system substrate-binding protein